jgi:hypothetical protein
VPVAVAEVPAEGLVGLLLLAPGQLLLKLP